MENELDANGEVMPTIHRDHPDHPANAATVEKIVDKRGAGEYPDDPDDGQPAVRGSVGGPDFGGDRVEI